HRLDVGLTDGEGRPLLVSAVLQLDPPRPPADLESGPLDPVTLRHLRHPPIVPAPPTRPKSRPVAVEGVFTAVHTRRARPVAPPGASGGRHLAEHAGQKDREAGRRRTEVAPVGLFDPPPDAFDGPQTPPVASPPPGRVELVALVLEAEPPRRPAEVDPGQKAAVGVPDLVLARRRRQPPLVDPAEDQRLLLAPEPDVARERFDGRVEEATAPDPTSPLPSRPDLCVGG